MTMDKAQALQNVLDLNRVADSATHEGEIEAARNRAVNLRLKFGISDEDIAAAVHDDEGFTHFGGPIFRYGNKVKPHLKAIQDHIDAVLGEVAKVGSPMEQVTLLGQLYRDLRDMVAVNQSDRSSVRSRGKYEIRTVQGHYYAAIKAFYDAEARESRLVYAKLHKETPRGQAQLDCDAHRHAVSTTASMCRLNKVQVESIVGVSEERLNDRRQKLAEEEKEATAR